MSARPIRLVCLLILLSGLVFTPIPASALPHPQTLSTPHGEQTRIWTDKPQYQIGDSLRYCYSVSRSGPIKITTFDANGGSRVIVSGTDDGKGGCGTGQVGAPTGTKRLRIDLYSGTTVLESNETTYQVVAAASSPQPPSGPGQCISTANCPPGSTSPPPQPPQSQPARLPSAPFNPNPPDGAQLPYRTSLDVSVQGDGDDFRIHVWGDGYENWRDWDRNRSLHLEGLTSQTYHWQAEARNRAGEGDWSPEWLLTILPQPTAPPSQPPTSTSVRLNPTSGLPGTSVTAIGDNWRPDISVVVYWDGTTQELARTVVSRIATATTGFYVTFQVPQNATPGPHTVLFIGPVAFQDAASATFNVTGNASQPLSPPAALPPQNQGRGTIIQKTFTVQANQSWQDTGVRVQTGNNVIIQYISGLWTSASGTVPLHDASGPPPQFYYTCASFFPSNQCPELVPDYSKGALVGRIGTQILRIGNFLQVTAEQDGSLYLAINDSSVPQDLLDNDGSVTVSIAVAVGQCISTANCPQGTQPPTPPVSPPPSAPAVSVPGGVWVNPPISTTEVVVGADGRAPLQLKARAYTNEGSGGAGVQRVEFTAGWPTPNPQTWQRLCAPTSPTVADVYLCDFDFAALPADQVIISFDVYDKAGKVNYAPNGTKRVVVRRPPPVAPPESAPPPGTFGCIGTSFGPECQQRPTPPSPPPGQGHVVAKGGGLIKGYVAQDDPAHAKLVVKTDYDIALKITSITHDGVTLSDEWDNPFTSARLIIPGEETRWDAFFAENGKVEIQAEVTHDMWQLYLVSQIFGWNWLSSGNLNALFKLTETLNDMQHFNAATEALGQFPPDIVGAGTEFWYSLTDPDEIKQWGAIAGILDKQFAHKFTDPVGIIAGFAELPSIQQQYGGIGKITFVLE